MVYAPASDSATTPKELIFQAFDRWRLPLLDFYDPFPHCPYWNSFDYFDAIVGELPIKVLFMNPPYSMAALMIDLGVLYFLLGANVLLLVEERSIEENKNYQLHYQYMCTTIQRGAICFEEYDRSTGKSHVLLAFLQPEHLEYQQQRWNQKKVRFESRLLSDFLSLRDFAVDVQPGQQALRPEYSGRSRVAVTDRDIVEELLKSQNVG